MLCFIQKIWSCFWLFCALLPIFCGCGLLFRNLVQSLSYWAVGIWYLFANRLQKCFPSNKISRNFFLLKVMCFSLPEYLNTSAKHWAVLQAPNAAGLVCSWNKNTALFISVWQGVLPVVLCCPLDMVNFTKKADFGAEDTLTPQLDHLLCKRGTNFLMSQSYLTEILSGLNLRLFLQKYLVDSWFLPDIHYVFSFFRKQW